MEIKVRKEDCENSLPSLLDISAPDINTENGHLNKPNHFPKTTSVHILHRDMATTTTTYPLVKHQIHLQQAIRCYYLFTGTTPSIHHFVPLTRECLEPIAMKRDPKISSLLKSVGYHSSVVHDVHEADNKQSTKLQKEKAEAHLITDQEPMSNLDQPTFVLPFDSIPGQETNFGRKEEKEVKSPIRLAMAKKAKIDDHKETEEVDGVREPLVPPQDLPFFDFSFPESAQIERTEVSNVQKQSKPERSQNNKSKSKEEKAEKEVKKVIKKKKKRKSKSKIKNNELDLKGLESQQQSRSRFEGTEGSNYTQGSGKYPKETDEFWLNDSFYHLSAFSSRKPVKQKKGRKEEFGRISCGKVELCGRTAKDLKPYAVPKFIVQVLKLRIRESESFVYTFCEQDYFVDETQTPARHEFFIYWTLWNKATILRLQRFFYSERKNLGPLDFLFCAGATVGDSAICTHVVASVEKEEDEKHKSEEVQKLKVLEDHVRTCLEKKWSLENEERLSWEKKFEEANQKFQEEESKRKKSNFDSIPSPRVSAVTHFDFDQHRIWSPHPFLSREAKPHIQVTSTLSGRIETLISDELPSDLIWCDFHPYFKKVTYVKAHCRKAINFSSLIPFCPEYQLLRDVPFKVKECYWILRQRCSEYSHLLKESDKILSSSPSSLSLANKMSLELSADRKRALRELVFKLYENFKVANLDTYCFSHLAFWNSFELVWFLLNTPKGMRCAFPPEFYGNNHILENLAMEANIVPQLSKNPLVTTSQILVDLGSLVLSELKWWDFYKLKQIVWTEEDDRNEKEETKQTQKLPRKSKTATDKTQSRDLSSSNKNKEKEKSANTPTKRKSSLSTFSTTKLEKNGEESDSNDEEDSESGRKRENPRWMFVSSGRVTVTLTLPISSFLILNEEMQKDNILQNLWKTFSWSDVPTVQEYVGELKPKSKNIAPTPMVISTPNLEPTTTTSSISVKSVKIDSIDRIHLFFDLITKVTLVPTLLLRSSYRPTIGISYSYSLNPIVSSSPLQNLIMPCSKLAAEARNAYEQHRQRMWFKIGEKEEARSRKRREMEQMDVDADVELERDINNNNDGRKKKKQNRDNTSNTGRKKSRIDKKHSSFEIENKKNSKSQNNKFGKGKSNFRKGKKKPKSIIDLEASSEEEDEDENEEEDKDLSDFVVSEGSPSPSGASASKTKKSEKRRTTTEKKSVLPNFKKKILKKQNKSAAGDQKMDKKALEMAADWRHDISHLEKSDQEKGNEHQEEEWIEVFPKNGFQERKKAKKFQRTALFPPDSDNRRIKLIPNYDNEDEKESSNLQLQEETEAETEETDEIRMHQQPRKLWQNGKTLDVSTKKPKSVRKSAQRAMKSIQKEQSSHVLTDLESDDSGVSDFVPKTRASKTRSKKKK